MRIAGFMLASGLLLAASPLFASTIAVGSCQPTKVSFPTIQQAVNAASAGTTISVCPGSYPEQVHITKNLTLKGFTFGNQNAAIITSPVGGMLPNATGIFGDTIEAQVFVQGATVTMSDLTMDAANSNLDSLGCSGDPVGIYYQNSNGTITRNSVLNDVLSPGLNGCQGGLGILVESTGVNAVAITFNHVEDYQKNGITVDGPGSTGLTSTITSNTVTGQGPTTGAAENSIQVAYGATATITSNTVGSNIWTPDLFGDTGDAASGILVYASSNVIIKSNNVSQTQYGIVIADDPSFGPGAATITMNTVSATHLYDGIDLCGSNNVVTSNAINGSDESAIHLDDTCTGASTGNIVKSNTINSACAGVLSGLGASGNTTAPNTYYNASNLQLTGTDTCTPPPASFGEKKQARAHGHFRPVKP
jgi:parallel beta-helix repeat protein